RLTLTAPAPARWTVPLSERTSHSHEPADLRYRRDQGDPGRDAPTVGPDDPLGVLESGHLPPRGHLQLLRRPGQAPAGRAPGLLARGGHLGPAHRARSGRAGAHA